MRKDRDGKVPDPAAGFVQRSYADLGIERRLKYLCPRAEESAELDGQGRAGAEGSRGAEI